MSTPLTITRRVPCDAPAPLAALVALAIRDYGAVTVTRDGAGFLLTAPCVFQDADEWFGPVTLSPAEAARRAAERRRVQAWRDAHRRPAAARGAVPHA